jgi:hypothetical protein
MGTAPDEATLGRSMFVFTDEKGTVVLMEDDLARVLGLDSAEDAIGDPLAAALGLSTLDAEKLLSEIAATRTARHRLAEIWNKRTGRRSWVLLGGSAPSTAGGFIGADISVSPVTLSPPAEDLDHRYNLERMAMMVRRRMRNGGGPLISEEKEVELRSYFAARMLAVYVLVVRMGGRPMAQAFEDRVRLISRDCGATVDMDRGRLVFGEEDLTQGVCRKITQAALSYAIQVTSKRMVVRELAELDVNFGLTTIQRAAHYGLRDDL